MPPAGGRESERASERERDGFEARLAHVEQHLAAAEDATSRAGSKAGSKAIEVVKLEVKLRGGTTSSSTSPPPSDGAHKARRCTDSTELKP